MATTSDKGNRSEAKGGSEHVFPSTTWEWRHVKISRPAGGHRDGATKSHRWFGRSSWKKRDPLSMKVSYRGGPEGWVEIHSRGSVGRFPGSVSILDVMLEIWQ